MTVARHAACDQTLTKCRMMAVEFVPGTAPRLGRPRALFAFDDLDLYFAAFPVRGYDVSRDGQRFYTVRTRNPPIPSPPAVTHVNVVLNWLEDLKARVPVR